MDFKLLAKKKMDFKFKGMKWVGNICQKFEEVCQEVDDIVGQSAVKYLEDKVQNVGNSVKKFCSDVVQVLPRPPSANSVKDEQLSLALSSDVDSPSESVAAFSEHNGRVEENSVNDAIESFQNSDANNLPNNHHAQAAIGHDPVNHVNDEIFSNSCEAADSCATGEEVNDDYSREVFAIIKQNLSFILEQDAVELTHEQFNVMSLNEKEPFESSTFSGSINSLTSSEVVSSALPSESSCLSESESLSARSQGRCCSEFDFSLEVAPSAMPNESSCLSESESLSAGSQGRCCSEFDFSLELKSSAMPNESSCLSESESLSARSQGRRCSEIDSFQENPVDAAGRSLEDCMVFVSCTATPDIRVAEEFMSSEAGILFCGRNVSKESIEEENSVVNEVMPLRNLPGTEIVHGQISFAQERATILASENDEPPVISSMSDMEDIDLSDNEKPVESCEIVDDVELHAASSRIQRLRAFTERIKDVFGRRKRLVKEYEQLAIWFGDCGTEDEGTSQSSTTYLQSKNPQVQWDSSEPEWEIIQL